LEEAELKLNDARAKLDDKERELSLVKADYDRAMSKKQVIHSFIHLDNSLSASSRNLHGGAPSPTMGIKIRFEQPIEQESKMLYGQGVYMGK